MARRLDEAPRPGGLYYTTGGQAIDANGFPLENAPDRPENTKPEDQPFARIQAATTIGAGGGGGTAFDAEALGTAIARGLTQAAGLQAAAAEAQDKSSKAHDDITDGAKAAKVKEGATPAATGSATAEWLQAPPQGVEPPPDGGAPDTPSSNKTGGGSKPTESTKSDES